MSGKKIGSIILATAVFSLLYGSQNDFRINQIGYYPEYRKLAIIIETQESSFSVVDESEEEVFTGELSEEKECDFTGVSLKHADFSQFTEEGVYRLYVADKGYSHPFKIDSRVLNDVAKASLKTFYFQRASMELEEQYAGIYARPAGHPDDSVLFHPSTGKPEDTPPRPSAGGWYDAGDYGKYVVNSGITMGTMLSFYENFPEYFHDGSMNIPESGNGIPDILDEIKYNADWMRTMQDDDGGVFHKMTSLRFDGTIMPHESTMDRYFIGISTPATLHFAAVMAMMARIYEPFDSTYARECLEQAERAWVWADSNRTIDFENPSDVGTGEYGGNNINGAFNWAAAELFITTGKEIYKERVDWEYSRLPGWANVHSMAALSLATIPNSLDEDQLNESRASIISRAEGFLNFLDNPFRTPLNMFIWGSNSLAANVGIAFIYAYLVSDDEVFLEGALEIADYLLGRNATGYSFITGHGFKTPLHPHHRPSASDGITEPIPGFIVGGPNGGADIYNDVYSDFRTNEVAINWNSPATVLFAALDHLMGDSTKSEVEEHLLLVSSVGPGRIEIEPDLDVYDSGMEVTFTAIPGSGEPFMGWSGALGGDDTVRTIIVDRDMRISATFGVPAGEQVANGDFSDGLNRWTLGTSLGGVGSPSVTDGEYHLSITDGGTEEWSLQIVQTGIQLIEGVTYEFRFDAYADEERTLIADIAMSAAPWSSYITGVSNQVDLGTEKTTYSIVFTPNSSDMGARITFNAGLSDADIYLDNVSLDIHDPSSVRDNFRQSHIAQNFSVSRRGNSIVADLVIVEPQSSTLRLYNASGRLVADLSSELRTKKAGRNSITINKKLGSGLYLIRYFDGNNTMTGSLRHVRGTVSR
ncbi:glycoside hydrolase family 9 protein [Chitinispirillales bacterium ANBcel5]|uniref:glycoside hydrolase family 9 protein n=1 Tax=Cellulosispirillum alkaliphilum TaxID=3039283 RepID=UPI002A4ED133|nr:glycoside hydrolase family 9 protein [Chitinispirillales bacterium ANBcel5]